MTTEPADPTPLSRKSYGRLTGRLLLREVEEADLAALFEHQMDPEAYEMAAFPPRNWDAFMTHWRGILDDETVIKQVIQFDSRIAGNIGCWRQGKESLIGYWLGREFWGQGIASHALSVFVQQVDTRPLYAYVVASNMASRRVLEKTGFRPDMTRTEGSIDGRERKREIVFVLSEPSSTKASPKASKPAPELPFPSHRKP